MPCGRCLNARKAVAGAVKAVARGDLEAAASEARVAGTEVVGKVKDEAQRVRAIFARRS